MAKTDDFAPDMAGETITGTSYLRQGKYLRTVTYTKDDIQANYDIYAVYAIRFKGTSEFAAYKYEY